MEYGFYAGKAGVAAPLFRAYAEDREANKSGVAFAWELEKIEIYHFWS